MTAAAERAARAIVNAYERGDIVLLPDEAYKQVAALIDREVGAEDDSPSGALWRQWFERLGIKADATVVNATANLLVAERKLWRGAAVDIVEKLEREAEHAVGFA